MPNSPAKYASYGLAVAERLTNAGKRVSVEQAPTSKTGFHVVADYRNFHMHRLPHLSALMNDPEGGVLPFVWPYSNRREGGIWGSATTKKTMGQFGRTIQNAAHGATIEYIAGVYCERPASSKGWLDVAAWTYTMSLPPGPNSQATWTISPRHATPGDKRNLASAIIEFQAKY
jgi:hypothetical protein